MPVPESLVVLLDVDNTLFDNDGFAADLQRELAHAFGAAEAQRYWACFEALRSETDCADYLGALQRFRRDAPPAMWSDPQLLRLSAFMLDYPFAQHLYADALAVIARLERVGTPVILSDGDVVFQPRKIERAGLWQAVQGHVLIYLHKERMLDAMQQHYPARHYVMVDDKVRVLSAMKAVLGERLTTVFPRQGHYALDAHDVARYPQPDITLERIGDLLHLDDAALAGQTRAMGKGMPQEWEQSS